MTATAAAVRPTSAPALPASTPPPNSDFAGRHIGPGPEQIAAMLAVVGARSLEDLANQVVPADIRLDRPLNLPAPLSEHAALAELARLAARNQVFTSYLGMGYHDCITPAVIVRNILENPGWYTPYTPYQAEISQGRLEALLNFQTLVRDLTGLEIANASLLDEGTAAAEAMGMSHAVWDGPAGAAFFVARDCHPQTIDVVRTRAEAIGVELVVGDPQAFAFDRPVFGVLLQYPATDGAIRDYREVIAKTHAAKALVTLAADPLALCLLTPPGELGADIAVGSMQRFGVPMGFGGPHAAYFATRDAFKRHLPGRLVGVSRDAQGRTALRLTLQTREQHIRRDKATSNICTAQVLLAVIASFYAVHHGPDGLTAIARRVRRLALVLADALRAAGYSLPDTPFFDTLRVGLGRQPLARLLDAARAARLNLRVLDEHTVGITLDETTTPEALRTLMGVFAVPAAVQAASLDELDEADGAFSGPLARRSAFLEHPVFHRFRSEHELLRYIKRLEAKDLSLTTSMIPLGSCTMKLNAAAEMLPVTWPAFGRLHPFVPREQAAGYLDLIRQLEADLAEITGFAAVSLQPNAGSQGEYAGLLAIRAYHRARGQGQRTACLIPTSAHGTNPASAVMAGMKVVPVACDKQGNVDVADLKAKADAHAADLAALMVTYPSTHGVFEERIREICRIVHDHGGQVYMDGANLNAQVGLCRPGDIGADVCHLNLHKTFCIPHGGGGPGMGPIGVAAHLAPFLPGHGVVALGGPQACGTISAAPYGSASILVISWMYIRMMGAAGLRRATQVAILNANYVARRLERHFPVLYSGPGGRVAHECILDLRAVKPACGVDVSDVAKRLMDYGFHAPTMSWPVGETLMVEPTESESQAELDRFCAAMIAIAGEIEAVKGGQADRADNPLKHAPHTAAVVTATDWPHRYTRVQAAYPAAWLREHKYWPPVGRVDNVFGDRNVVCACPPMESYAPPA